MESIYPNSLRFCRLTRIVATALCVSLLVTCSISCKDDPDDWTLPPATSNGAGTFGCLIDGKVYIPYGEVPWVDPGVYMTVVYASSEGHSFALMVRDKKDGIVENKRYYFEGGEDVKLSYTTISPAAYCFYEDPPVTGSIMFSRVDFEAHVISGTFEFTAYSDGCNKSVTVTEGRFDLRTDR